MASILAMVGITNPGLFGIALASLVVLFAAFRVDFAFLVVIFFFPMMPQLPIEAPIRDIGSLVRLLMFVVVLAGQLMSGESWKDWLFGKALDRMAVLYTAVAFFSLLVSAGDSSRSVRSLFRLLSYVAFYFAISGWVRNEKQLRKALGAMLLSILVIVPFGFYQALIGDFGGLYYFLYSRLEASEQPWMGRITSVFADINPFAGYLNLLLAVSLALIAMPIGRTLKRLAVFSFLAGSAALVLTQSRGGLLAYAVTILLAILFLARDWARRLRFLCVFLLLAGLFWPVAGALFPRMAELDDFTVTGRGLLILAGWNMFLSSPVLGVGYGQFSYFYDPALVGASVGRANAHNVYVSVMAETGMAGLIAFLFLCATAIRLSWSQIRSPIRQVDRVVGFAALAAFSSVLVQGFSDDNLQVTQFGAVFWLILGLLIANERLRTLRTPKLLA